MLYINWTFIEFFYLKHAVIAGVVPNIVFIVVCMYIYECVYFTFLINILIFIHLNCVKCD